MFTGIITQIGRVRRIEAVGGGAWLEVEAAGWGESHLGASIACSGVCLTVVEHGRDWFAAQLSAETLARCNLGDWSAGTQINLEWPLKLGEELGGHLVLGHVDGIAEVSAREVVGESVSLTLAAPKFLAPFIAAKGSVALDGVSLTVNNVAGAAFGVNVIPHTLAVTTLGKAAAGTKLNLEVDPLARYVSRQRDVEHEA